MNAINFDRLYKLNQLVNANKASKDEMDEYMLLLYRNKSITEKQYEDYKHDKNKEDLINLGLTLGGIILVGYLLSKLTNN